MPYEYKIQIAKDEDEHFVDMAVITVTRDDAEVMKYSGFKASLQNLLCIAAGFIADNVKDELEAMFDKAHDEDCDYIKSIVERDDKHRRVPVRECNCSAKEDTCR